MDNLPMVALGILLLLVLYALGQQRKVISTYNSAASKYDESMAFTREALALQKEGLQISREVLDLQREANRLLAVIAGREPALRAE